MYQALGAWLIPYNDQKRSMGLNNKMSAQKTKLHKPKRDSESKN